MQQHINIHTCTSKHLPLQAIEEALTPRLSVTGEIGTLTKFKQFFQGKSLEKGTNILLLWRTEGVLEVLAKADPASQDYTQVPLSSVLLHEFGGRQGWHVLGCSTSVPVTLTEVPCK